MLDPDYFTHKEDRLLSMFDDLEAFILKDIARRLINAGEPTASADYLMARLGQMGESREAINKKLMDIADKQKAEVKAILQEAVKASFADDEAVFNQLDIKATPPPKNNRVREIMDAEYKKTLGELTNLTRTTADTAQADLIRMLDDAELLVSSGAQSYNAAICDILDKYADAGIRVSYPNGAGTTRTLETAVRCAVVTSINQTAAQVSNAYIVEAGVEYVLVSAHLGARVKGKGQPELAGHDSWQGKIYRIEGSEPGYPNLTEKTGYSIDPETGTGTVVNPLGLHGYNCRHSHKPWDKSLRNPYVDADGKPTIDTDENRRRYELNQKQRSMERNIRAVKRRIIAKQAEMDLIKDKDLQENLQKEFITLSQMLTQKNGAYNAFCESNKLHTQYERLKVSGYGRRQENAVKKAVKSAMN